VRGRFLCLAKFGRWLAGWLLASAPVVTDSRAGESGLCLTQQLTAKRFTLADRKQCLSVVCVS
jgi:hypothetical protein